MDNIYLGNLLIDNINSNTDLKKIKLLTEITKYRKNNNNKKRLELMLIDEYDIKYNKPRLLNNINYDEYVKQRLELYNKWYSTKNIKYDELTTVNSIFGFIYYKEFYTNALEDVIAFLHEFLSKIKKLTQETKMIVTKCLDSLVKKRSRYQNNWHDRELESLRQQIRESWN